MDVQRGRWTCGPSSRARTTRCRSGSATYAERKLGRLERLLDDRSDATVELSVEQHRSVQDSHIVDVTLVIDGQTLRSSAAAPTHQAGIDAVLDKIERRAVDHRETSRVRKSPETVRGGGRAERRGAGRRSSAERPTSGQIVKVKRFNIEPMFEEDAVARMEELGHSFFVFVNAENERVAILYRRSRRRLRPDRADGRRRLHEGRAAAPIRPALTAALRPSDPAADGAPLTLFDRLSLLAVVASPRCCGIPGIDARGRFDADQGHDMAHLVAFTRDGVIPLLGPKTSVGEFHHGAFYYFLLAPAAAVSGGDPVAVTTFIALLGIAAVALTWWLARSIGGRVAGPVAGLVAGTLLAVVPCGDRGVDLHLEPEPDRVLRGACPRRGLEGAGRAAERAWWALAIGSAGAVTQLHVLGVVFLIAMLAIGLLELRRDRAVLGGLLTGLLAVGVLFLPLLVHELRYGFPETRAVVAYVSGDDGRPRRSLERARVHAAARRRLAARRPGHGRARARGHHPGRDARGRRARPAHGPRGGGDRASLARRRSWSGARSRSRSRRRRSSASSRACRTTTTTRSSTRSSSSCSRSRPVTCSRAPRRSGARRVARPRSRRSLPSGSGSRGWSSWPSRASRHTSIPMGAGRPPRPPASGSSR